MQEFIGFIKKFNHFNIKMYGRRRSYKYGRKSTFMRKATRGGFKPKAFESRYDGDAWIKVEKTANLNVDALGNFWAGARTDNATTTG